MDGLHLNGRQRRALQREMRGTDDAALCRRLLALLEVDSGQPITHVAQVLGVTRQTVHNWIRNYLRSGIPEALADRPRSGRPLLWTEEVDAVLEEYFRWSPDDWGYQAVSWTVPLLRCCLEERAGLPISRSTIRQRLHGLGYVWKRSRYVLKPDPEREKKTTDSPENQGVFAADRPAVRGRNRSVAVSSAAVRLGAAGNFVCRSDHGRQRQAGHFRSYQS